MKTATFILAMLVSTCIFAQGAKRNLISNVQDSLIVKIDGIPNPPPTPPPTGGGNPGGGGPIGRS